MLSVVLVCRLRFVLETFKQLWFVEYGSVKVKNKIKIAASHSLLCVSGDLLGTSRSRVIHLPDSGGKRRLYPLYFFFRIIKNPQVRNCCTNETHFLLQFESIYYIIAYTMVFGKYTQCNGYFALPIRFHERSIHTKCSLNIGEKTCTRL